MAAGGSLQFAPFASDIELPFYSALASHKINHDKLDDSARKLLGLYEVRPNDMPEASCRMQVLGNALITDDVPAGYCRAEGIIKNVNTVEDYKLLDKTAMLHRAAHTVNVPEIWEAILDGTVYSCPSLLSSFLVISFADLKKYKFMYWFAFPALHSEPSWKTDGKGASNEPEQLASQETTLLVERVQTWRYSVDSRQHGFFLAKRVRSTSKQPSAQIAEDPEGSDVRPEEDNRPPTPSTPGQTLGFTWDVSSLSSFENGFFDGADPEDCFVAFVDPSTYPSNPGWMLRNLLFLVQRRWKLRKVQILCYRDVLSRRDEPRSTILNLACTSPSSVDATPSEQKLEASPQLPKVTGWERNKNGKLASKTASLAEYLDPTRLADQSVDLNLKLMRWRIAPTLDLEKIKNTKCLLLGAGTLGSYVSRNLLGWGVRHITFVDNGSVSFSNPVRQPLFTFNDCLSGGAKKAPRAADALREIYPGVTSAGHVLSVPMAGHPVTDEAQTRSDFDKLYSLIDEHDVVFLLMDTRESRWLPTVMAKAAGKIVMNAALGFDTFVVLRHGLKPPESKDAELELGCYFCNDVVAPADSIKDQTLDQQCTVTRPGIASIASALAVELLVSILQHPLGGFAPAPSNPSSSSSSKMAAPSSSVPDSPTSPDTHPLGLIPHQIRGFLSSFSNLLIRGQAFDHCSACSAPIVDAYRDGGWDFVRRAVGERGFVEEVSGLREVQRRAEEMLGDVDWIEEEEEDGEGELI
ncbi:MAG: Autophagy protein 7 [Piccolia ochrophora]|nr:MAG: Autophagy protein 7 [Piccolia ochrophora]